MIRFSRRGRAGANYQAINLQVDAGVRQGKRECAMVVLVQLDFSTAFNSTDKNAVYRTLQVYAVPVDDMELLRRMQTFIMMDPLIRILRAPSRTWKPTGGGPMVVPTRGTGQRAKITRNSGSHPAPIYFDDILLVTFGPDPSTLLAMVQGWEP